MKEIAELRDRLPVPWSDTFEVLDSTKIKAFMDCQRGFFYAYVLGWRPKDPNIHLEFGKAWHDAQEILLHNQHEDGGYTQSGVRDAILAFAKTYNEGYPRDLIGSNQYANKDIDNGVQALLEYANFYQRDRFEVIYTETAGTVPISPDRLIHFKSDAIVRDHLGIWALEHKTTGRLTNKWSEQWSYDFQVGCYSHVLHCLFPNEARGVRINGAVLRKPTKSGKANNEFIRVPVILTPQMLQAWMWEANHWVDLMIWNFQELARAKSVHPVMTAFPRNPASCSKFGCRYPELCCIDANPLQRLDPPVGYEVDHWDPRRKEAEAKHIVHIEKLP